MSVTTGSAVEPVWSRKFVDLTGQRFGRLVVLERGSDYVSPSGHHRPRWMCACDCGGETTSTAHNLRRGHARSCGCVRIERLRAQNTTHGLSTSGTWQSWKAMKSRCLRPRSVGFTNYGGRGIEVCDRWLHSFANFLADMGERPDGTSLDRIDVNGNYEPSNCRWATASEQARNQRRLLSKAVA